MSRTDDPADGDDGDMMHVHGAVEEEDPANAAPKFSDDQDPNTRTTPSGRRTRRATYEPVTANDPGDLLVYSLSGADSASFTVDSGLKKNDSAGQIKTKEKLDYETRAMYMVVVTATDPSGATDNIMVNIEVDDVDDKTVVSIVTEPEPVAPEPEPEPMADCSNVTAVDSANAGLVADCEALLDAKEMLEGGGSPLNWHANTPIADWDGIQGHAMFPSLSGDTMRVTALHLQNGTLDGEIPDSIGDLDALMYLNVHSNSLSGDLSALGGLENLVRIYANNNELDALGDLSGATSLEILWAHQNTDMAGPLMADYLPASLTWISLYDTALGGGIPDLSALTGLERLYLDKAGLSGEIPASLGSVTSLTHLRLKYNSLSGDIPMELNNLTNLEWVRINFADDADADGAADVADGLTGCIPEALTAAEGRSSDAEHLGLPTCQ